VSDGRDPSLATVPSRRAARWTVPILVPLVALAVSLLAQRVSLFYGVQGLLIFVVSSAILLGLFLVSVRHLEAAVLLWALSLLGFRNVLLIPVPTLPDLSIDRILLLWILSLGMLRALAGGARAERPYLPDVLLVIYMLYLLGSIMVFNPTVTNLWTRSYLMPTAAYFFGKYFLRDEVWFRRFAWGLVVVTFYHTFTALAEKFGLDFLVWPKHIIAYKDEFQGRSVSIFGNPAALGVFLAMAVPFHLYLLQLVRHRTARLFLTVGILMAPVAILFTYTRGGWLAAIVGVGVLSWASWRVYGRRMLAYGLMVAVVLVGWLSFQEDEFLRERATTEETVTGRVNAMGTAVRMWADRPIFGVGFFRYNDLQFEYREAMEVPIFGLVKAQTGATRSLHDIYVGQLAETGVVGTTIRVLLHLTVLTALWRMYWRRRGDGTLLSSHVLPAVMGSLAAYYIGGLTFDYRYFTALNSLFFLLFGIIIGWEAWARAGRPVQFLPRS
jgi:hypothetical protein